MDNLATQLRTLHQKLKAIQEDLKRKDQHLEELDEAINMITEVICAPFGRTESADKIMVVLQFVLELLKAFQNLL